MTNDPKLKALESDIEAARERVQAQAKADPDHEVALAMFRADLRRATQARRDYVSGCQREQPAVRQYVDGRLAT